MYPQSLDGGASIKLHTWPSSICFALRAVDSLELPVEVRTARKTVADPPVKPVADSGISMSVSSSRQTESRASLALYRVSEVE